MYSHMLRKQAPVTYRVFKNDLSEQLYLFIKLSYWLHVAKNRKNATRYVERLREMLQKRRMNSISIGKYSMLATIAEFDRSWADAIKHRKKEVSLIKKLYDSFANDQSDELRNHFLQDSKPRQVIRYLGVIKKTYQEAGQEEGVKVLTDLQEEIRQYQGRF